MFDKPLDFRFVQRNRNKSESDPYKYEYIYKFFLRNQFGCRKIIVQVKQYSETHFKIDFYATISCKQKDSGNLAASIYRYKTNIGRANRVASTIFAILGHMRTKFPNMSFACQAATALDEDDDHANKRFRVYLQIFRLVIGSENNIWKVFEYTENSFIFVVQKRFAESKPLILKEYGIIFDKVFES